MHVAYYLTGVVYFCAVSASVPDSKPCTTPNGEASHCISLLSCPVLRSAVGVKDEAVKRFVEASALDCGHQPLFVCCGRFGNYTKISANSVPFNQTQAEVFQRTQNSKREDAIKLLPAKTYCGMQHADDYFRDINTSDTSVDELPWVVFLSCEDSDSPKASSISSTRTFAITSRDCDCSGVLINHQYVLTASNCASAKWVGLGQREQYKNVSCTKTAYEDDCSEAVTKTPFTEQIRSPNGTLLLLRLKSKITYTDYIRPICLPLEENDRVRLGETITIAKWKIDSRVLGLVRSKINQTLTTNDKCLFNFEELKLVNSPGYMCTRLENDETLLCKTDSGGPMMYKRDNNWFMGGILHSGRCIAKTAVGNRITAELVDWILDNIKP